MPDIYYKGAINTEPLEATISPMVTKVCFVPSSRLFGQSTTFRTTPTMDLIAGIKSSPKEIASSSKANFRMVI